MRLWSIFRPLRERLHHLRASFAEEMSPHPTHLLHVAAPPCIGIHARPLIVVRSSAVGESLHVDMHRGGGVDRALVGEPQAYFLRSASGLSLIHI